MPALSEDAIFDVARRIRSPEARDAYLEQACDGNEALLARLLDLIAAHEAADSRFDNPALPATAEHAARQLLEQEGDQIGPYKLRERLGEGGMGVVWAADRKKPLHQKVALKVIKPGLDTEQVLARFEAEKHALSLMNHPNIARVFDAGTTEPGRPYFVMELIRGIPITDYCDANKLTVRQRLELFTQACKAVQHAHQKGVVHRDIKPTNILVTEQDGMPILKVIDFGVAKALHGHSPDNSVYSGLFQAIGTLAYMSPEQAGLSASDIDTRADVYSLGVLLYEMLTSRTPFEKDELASAALAEACRIICETDPPKPSTRVSNLGDDGRVVSCHRNTDTTGLCRTIRGDLDWIVMKCLAKDRRQRYETPSALADDVVHFLHDEEVSAHAPSALCAKMTETTSSSFITVEGEEEHDVKGRRARWSGRSRGD